MKMTDPFGRTRVRATWDRDGRVRLLREAAAALLRGQMPDAEAATFLGSALSAWLSEGGSLEREFLQVSAPQGSHRTPAYIASLLDEGGAEDEATNSGDSYSD